MSQGLWVCPIKIAGMYDYIRRIKILLWVLLHPPYLADVTTRDRVGGVLRHHSPSCPLTLLSPAARGKENTRYFLQASYVQDSVRALVLGTGVSWLIKHW